jgi:hypothetical protein
VLKELKMKRFAAASLFALILVAIPCQAQFLKSLEKDLLGGQGQAQQQGAVPGQQGQPSLIGNVNLPPGQYMMTNVQTGQAFYVSVQAGQMFLSGPPASQQMMAPGQGMMQQQQPMQQQRGGFGNFLRNEVAPQQQGPN